MSCCSHTFITVTQVASCLQVSDSYWHHTRTKETFMGKNFCRGKKNNSELYYWAPAILFPTSQLERTSTHTSNLFFSFSGTQYSDQGHLRCSPNAAPAPPLSGSHSGDGHGERCPPALGRGGGKAWFTQTKHCLFSLCYNLLWLVHRGNMSGLGQSLLPSLMNCVTASFSC